MPPSTPNVQFIKRVWVPFGAAVGVILIVIVVFKGNQYGLPFGDSNPTPSERILPALVVDSSYLDFGTVWEQEQFEWSIPIENRSDAAITVESFRSSCLCTDVTPRRFVIPANGSRTIQVTLDLTEKDNHLLDPLAPLTPRPFSVTIEPILTPPPSTTHLIAWQLKGRVQPAYQLQQEIIDFGQRSVLAQPFEVESVPVLCDEQVQDIRVDCNADWVACTVQRNSRTSFNIQVTPYYGMPAGYYPGTLRIFGITRTGEPLPEKRLSVAAHILGDIQPTPPQLLWPAKPIGQLIEDSLELRSLTNRDFTIDRIETDSDKVEVLLIPGDPLSANSRRVQVRYVISRAGDQKETIRFHVTPVGEVSEVITVTLVVTGAEPPVSLQRLE